MEKLYSLFEIAELIAKEKSGIISDSESETLNNWLAENDNNKMLYNKFQDGEMLLNKLDELKKYDEVKAYKNVEEKISKERKQPKILKLVPNYMKYAAAVALLVVCSYFIIHQFREPNKPNYVQSTILPGKQKAILITANNREILLDSTNEKQIIKDSSVNIIQTGSTLSYNNTTTDNAKPVTAYNTLITPLGGEYTLILSDGTEVMLNAGSKLKYPVVFNGDNREVELEGEAFFKVTKFQKTPFIVKINNVNVTVYGTVFNVSAYNNENLMQTTLVEGSVGISINSNKTKSELKIKPGQQYTYNKYTGNSETKEVDIQRYIAWTKGMFVFENESIENILKVMSRWYDFDFAFKDNNLKRERFTLKLGRNDNVFKILDMISVSSNLKFSVKENSILVYSE